VLAQRAAYEGPRWARAVETTPAASLDAGKERGNRLVTARSEGQLGYSLVEEVVYREAPQIRVAYLVS
jgi:hypothetical protein